jgi:hypothetical protein
MYYNILIPGNPVPFLYFVIPALLILSFLRRQESKWYSYETNEKKLSPYSLEQNPLKLSYI